MINTHGLQQVLDEIDKMLAAENISVEEAVTMKSEAKVAAEEGEDTVEETEVEEEEEEEEEVEEETEGEEESEEEVEEVEEEVDEEVDEEEEVVEEEEEEEVEEEEIDTSELKPNQLKKLEKLLQEGGGEDFDIENLNKRKQKLYKKLIGETTEHQVIGGGYGSQTVEYNNGASEKDTDIVQAIKDLDSDKILDGYITDEKGDKKVIYEYANGVDNPPTGINSEVTDEELFKKYMTKHGDGAWILPSGTTQLDEVYVGTYKYYDKETGELVELTYDQMQARRTLAEVNNNDGEDGETIKEIFNLNLQEWVKNGQAKIIDELMVVGGDNVPARYTFDVESVDEAIALRKDMMREWLAKNEVVQDIIIQTEPAVKEKIKVKVEELATSYGLYNRCSADPTNCIGTVDEYGVSNYEKYLTEVSRIYNKVYNTLLDQNPDYTNLVDTALDEFDKLFAQDQNEYMVQTNSADFLKFGIDVPGIGYVPTGQAMQSMANMLGLQYDKGEFNAFTRETNTVSNTFQEGLNIIEDAGLADDSKICVSIQNLNVEQASKERTMVGSSRRGSLGDVLFGRPMADRFNGAVIGTDGNCRQIPEEFKRKSGLFGPKVHTTKIMTVGEYKTWMENKIGDDSREMFKKYFAIKDSEALAQFFKTYDFSGIERGDPKAIASMLSEQSVMMGYALITAGTGPGFNQGQETMFNLLEKEALNRLGIKNSSEVSDEEFLAAFTEVVDDDEYWVKSNIKSEVTGVAFMGLEAFPWFKALKFAQPAMRNFGTSILRGNMRGVLKALGHTGVESVKQAAREGVTEFLQELLVGTVEEKEMHLYENALTGFVAGAFLPGGISIVKQSVTEIQTIASVMAGKLNPLASENFFNNTLSEMDEMGEGSSQWKSMSPKARDEFLEKYKVIKDLRDANKKIPSTLIGPERQDYLDLLIANTQLEEQKANSAKEFHRFFGIKIAINEFLMQEAVKNNEIRKTVRGEYEKYEILFEDVENVDVINLSNEGINKFEGANQGYQDYEENLGDLIIKLQKNGWRIDENAKSQVGTTLVKYKPDGTKEFKVILNEDLGVINKRLDVGTHEIGAHVLLRTTLDKNPKVAETLGNSILKYLTKADPNIWDSEFGKRLQRYGTIDENGVIQLTPEALKRGYNAQKFYEEVIAHFGEMVGEEEIRLSDRGWLDLGKQFTTVFKGLYNRIWGVEKTDLENKLEFNNVEDIKKFFKTLKKDANKGELSEEMKIALTKGVTGKLIEELTNEENTELNKAASIAALGDEKLTPEIEKEVELDLEILRGIKEENQLTDASLKTSTETLIENRILEAIKPTVTAVALNRTKAFYDNIPADLKRNVSREDYVQSIINDANMMVLRENWDPSRQSLEKWIVNRMFERTKSAATRLGVKQNIEGDIDTLYDMPASEDETVAEEIVKKRKISPTKMLGDDLAKMAEERVIEKAKDLGLDINNLKYKDVVRLRDLAAQEVAAYFGVAENKVIAGKDNLTKAEALAARMVINRDADKLLSLLPEAYSKELDTTTGIPNTILNATFIRDGKSMTFYNKGEDGIWRLRKDLKRKEFLHAFGIRTDGTYNAKSDGQIIKALMQMMNANVSIEQLSKMEGLTTQGRFILRSGGSESLAALGPALTDYYKKHGIVQDVFKDLETGEEIDYYDMVADLQGGLNSLLPGIQKSQVLQLFSGYLQDENEFRKAYPKTAKIIKDYTEATMKEYAEEGKLDAQGYTYWVKDQILNNTLTDDVALNEALKTGNYMTISNAQLKNNPKALQNFFNQNIDIARFLPFPEGILDVKGNNRMIYGSLGSYGAGRIIGHENANLNDIYKDGKLVRKAAPYMVNLTKALNRKFKDYKSYKKAGGFLTEENYNRYKNLDWESLSHAYEGEKLRVYNAAMQPGLDFETRRQLIMSEFGSQDGKTMLEYLDLQMSTLQDYVQAAKNDPKEFAKRTDHMLRLLSTNAELSGGIRLFSNGNYMYIPKDDSEAEKIKYEHLMSSNAFNKNAAQLILNNEWGKTEKSQEVLNQYNGIYGFARDFDLIDNSTGKTNTSLMFRMAYNLDIAKNTYTLDSGLTKTVYDEIMETIGVRALRDFEMDAEAISRHNYAIAANNGLDFLFDFNEDEYANNQQQLDVMSDMDNTVKIANDPNAEDKGITVADFDDTVALSKSKVLYTLPDGTTGELNAADFAKQYGELQGQGAEFNFDQFNEVIDGKPGPMLERIKQIADKFGTDEVYILTARDPKSAEAIQLFLKEMGLNIPIENIVGLADGTAEAKGRWVLDKTADGYNNWFFTDDQLKNVEEVERVLNIAARSVNGMKIDTQLSLAALSDEEINSSFNRYLETSTGIGAQKTYSTAKGRLMGRKAKAKFLDVIMPYSAEDFKGLLYTTLASGKEGEAQFDFYKKHLIDPYNKAINETNTTMVTMSNDYRDLKKDFPSVPKTLNEQSNVSGYTVGDALRVYMWTKDGHEIPGLSKTDKRRLLEHIENNPDYIGFAQGIVSLQKNRGYPGPTENWLAGNVATDIIGGINSINRSDSLISWQKNVDIIFSEQNLAKLEAAYGGSYVKNLKATLARMKSGRNRLPTGNATTDNVLDWINNSVGNVMFLNTRSAALQTLSSVNFINWGDNNILNAGKAFANQPQYWSDFAELFNSNYLKNRRVGLRINVTESEIADAVKDSKNKSKAAIAYLLNKGFVLTRVADSFAIASGGATFYRNRINTYLNEGMSEEEAKEQAFLDFHAISEETQQSADASKISEQQASNAGRIILAFANTPMQYARLQKRAAQDLMAGRGDYREHISKLAYYGVAQNIIFNSLQQAFFTEMFEGEDDEGEDGPMGNKAWDIINGMSSSNLRGLGVGGAAVDALKNSLITIAEESGKNSPDFTKAINDLFDVAPPLDSKLRKLQSAAKTFSWNRKDMKEQGFDINNPAILAGAQVISAFTNIPIDRAIMKLNNIRNVLGEESEKWQKIALLLGYSAWELGLPYYGVESIEEKEKKAERIEERKKQYNNDIRKLKAQGYKRVKKGACNQKGVIKIERPTNYEKSPITECWLKK